MSMKIERRRLTVTLFQGNYEQELADLFEDAMTVERLETMGGQKRASTKSKANVLAKRYDELLAETHSTAVKVTVWAISRLLRGPLEINHPPRDGNAEDKQRGFNMDTFPAALLRLSLVSPDDAKDLNIAQLESKGEVALDELGDLSWLHYRKLETAAWNVNVGDEDIPKDFSLVSVLKQQRDLSSKQPSEQE